MAYPKWLIGTVVSAACLTAVGVAVLVLSEWTTTPGQKASDPPKQEASRPVQTVERPISALSKKCSEVKTPYTLGPNPVQINPNGDCSSDLYYDEQDVKLWVRRAGKSQEEPRPYGRGERFPNDVEWIRSEGKTFPAFVALVLPRYH